MSRLRTTRSGALAVRPKTVVAAPAQAPARLRPAVLAGERGLVEAMTGNPAHA